MFTSISSRAASAYKRVSVQTSVDGASPHQLVVLLYEALLASLPKAARAIQAQDVQSKSYEIGRSVRILEEGLLSGLNTQDGGEVAVNLRSLYAYCIQCLTRANVSNDAQKVAEVIALIEPVAQAWSQIGLIGNAVQPTAGV